MKKVSIRQAILDAIDDTDDTIARHMNQLIKWAKYCEKAIGSANGYPIKSSLHTVTDAEIILPDDCYKVIGVIPGNYTDEINLKYYNLETVNVNVENISDDEDLEYVWGDLSTTLLPGMLWEEIGNKVNIVDQYEDADVTLVYQYIETDDKGFWLVNESHIDAIMKFLIYKYAKKFAFRQFKSSKLTRNADREFIRELKADYSHGIRNSRALDGEESPMNTLG
jgi:hypothetical protein